MPANPGDIFGPYQIVSRLGAGGMGEVYRARDTRLNRDVALKMLPPDMAADPERRARFQQESRTLAALSHPNLLTVFDVGENYFVAELVPGESLDRKKDLGPRRSAEIAAQIAEGLGAAHAQGITHRDLKPANVMVTPEGRVKILDFGLARQAAAPGPEGVTLTLRSVDGAVMGTPGYMSPEQVEGRVADPPSDIFSLGVVLYEMLAGRPAFPGATMVDRMHAAANKDPEPCRPRRRARWCRLSPNAWRRNPRRGGRARRIWR